MPDSRVLTVLAYGWIALCLLLALRDTTPPAPLGVDAPADTFSAARAMEIVRELAATPRPRGSEGHARAKDAIVRRLNELGLTPIVHSSTTRSVGGEDWATLSTLTNVFARIEGSADGDELIVLMAHYDSVAPSPGAADDASGVATVLEAARALLAGAPPERDVLILLTDGEEEGLLGARAFAGIDEIMANIRVVLNFEARGRGGPSILFETLGGNRGLIEAYAAVDHPFTTSVSDEVYRRMPNGTDLTVFRDKGIHGMNFAFIGGLSHYHSALDTPDALDKGSLQQHGEAAVTLARRFGSGSLELGSADDNAIYFSALGHVFGYPTGSRWPVLAAALVALIVAIRFGFRRGWIRPRSLLFGALFLPISCGLSVIAALAVLAFVNDATTDSAIFGDQQVYEAGGYAVGVVLLAVSITTFVLLQLRTRAKPEGLVAGSLLWWAVLAIVSAGWYPSASYLFAWPLLSSALALLLFLRRERRLSVTPGRGLGVLVLSAPGWILWCPLLWLLFESLQLPVAPLLAGLSVLLLGVAVPPLFFAMAHRRLFIPLGAGLAGFLWIGYTAVAGEPSEGRPYRESFSYLADQDSGQAVWLPRGPIASEWGATLLADRREIDAWRLDPTLERGVRNGAVAPLVSVPAPSITAGVWTDAAEERRFTGTIEVPPGTCQLLMVVEGSAKGGFTEIDRVPFALAAVRTNRISWVAPPEKLEVSIAADSEGSVTLRLFAVRFELPDLSGTSLPPRPALVIPRSHSGDETVVSRRFEL